MLETLGKLEHQRKWIEKRIDALEEVIASPAFKENTKRCEVGDWWEVFRNIQSGESAQE